MKQALEILDTNYSSAQLSAVAGELRKLLTNRKAGLTTDTSQDPFGMKKPKAKPTPQPAPKKSGKDAGEMSTEELLKLVGE